MKPDIDGVVNNVEDGVNGLIVNSCSYEELSDKINKLISSDELAYKLGEMGYSRSIERFDMNINIHKIIAIYGRLFSCV